MAKGADPVDESISFGGLGIHDHGIHCAMHGVKQHQGG